MSTVLAPDVRCNALALGGLSRGQPESFVRAYEARVPLGRMGTEGDIRGPTLFLASDMLSPHAFSRPTRHKTALSLVVSVLATLFLLAPSARAQTSYPLHGTAKLRGCSGALFQYEGQPDSDLALIMGDRVRLIRPRQSI